MIENNGGTNMNLRCKKMIISLYISILNGTYKISPISDSIGVGDSKADELVKENQLSLLDNEPDTTNHSEKNDTLNVEVNKMKLYGRIETENRYYNFYPQYVDRGDGLVELKNVKELFPTKGGICLSAGRAFCKLFLENLNVPEHNDNTQKIYVVEIFESDLQDNGNDYITKKIDLDDMVENGKKLADMIYGIETEHFYRVVVPAFQNSKNLFADDTLEIAESECNIGELVLLASNDRLYGPFKVIQGYADKKYISLNVKKMDYLVEYCHVSECRKLEFEKWYEKWYYSYDENPLVVVMYQFSNACSKEDVIPDNILLENLRDDIHPELAIKSPDEFVRICSNNSLLSKLPDDIRKKRIDRVHRLIANSSQYQEVLKELLTILLHRPDIQIPESLIKASDIYNKQLEKSSNLLAENEELQKRIDEMSSELKESRAAMSSSRSGSIEDIEKLKKTIEELEKQIAQYQANEAQYQAVEQLKKQKEELEPLVDYLANRKSKLEKEVQDAITNGFEHGTTNMTVEPYIYHTMLQKASEWALGNDAGNFRKYADILTKHESEELSGEALIKELVKRVQNKRNYGVNDILNIYISLVQNFITVFSGEPGIGKTSICGIVAESLGLDNFGETDDGKTLNRFLHISVERGWQSKRDLIGYFNPLTRKYDRSNNGMYDALRILDAEREASKFPFFILLDEANLSPLEYYWSDFIHLADEPISGTSCINIGTNTDIHIPKTLRFMATINNDQTTEQLSPRFIDRATIIKLPTVPLNLSNKEDSGYTPIDWENLVKIFGVHNEDEPKLAKVLDEIYELFRRYNMNVSPRVRISINKYIRTAQEIMESENDISKQEKATDYAVLQRLIPKINGSFDFYKPMFDKLKQICSHNNLKMTLNAIETMEKLQAENMGYCQYLM